MSFQFLDNHVLLGSVLLSVLSLSIFGVFWFLQKKKNAVPTRWKPIGTVKNVFIYPLKRGRRIELQTAVCTDIGVRPLERNSLYHLRDRNLQVYKEQNMKNLNHPKLLLISIAAYDENHITLNAPGMSSLKVKIPNKTETGVTESVFYVLGKLPTIDCGNEAAQWLSKFIYERDFGLRLGYHDGSPRRTVLPILKQHTLTFPNLKDATLGIYTNITTYLVMNQSSVDDLCSRIPESNITANNFRPTILIEGPNAFAEDEWRWIKIGDAILYSVLPCTRCIVTTMNPETGVRNADNEPLRTLRKYRLQKDIKKIKLDGDHPIMGVYMALHSSGRISVGDNVYVG